MSRKNVFEDLLKTAAVVGGAGMLFASSCSLQEMEAVGVGIDAVAGYFNDQAAADADADDDISFGDWLADELKD